MKRRNKLISVLTVVAALTSTNIFANKVKFSNTSTSGSFYCIVDTITYRFKKVDIHTSGVEASGFCEGEEYVKKAGHITGMSMSELKKFHFDYQKTFGKEGSVDIVATNKNDIACYEGKGENTKTYGNGKYC